MKRFSSLVVALFVVGCSGAPPSALDDPAQPAAQTEEDAAARPDVLELPDIHEDASAPDASAPDLCSHYAAPDTQATCHACSGTSCQSNGCFGGYYCDLVTTHCVPQPDGC